VRKKRAIIAAVLLLGLLGVSGIFLWRNASARPPALYVNGVPAQSSSFDWRYPGGSIESDAPSPLQMKYGPENVLHASPKQPLVFTNNPRWWGVRDNIVLNFYNASDVSAWDYNDPPPDQALVRRQTDPKCAPDLPGSYIVDIFVSYGSLFASGRAHYGIVIYVE